MSTPKRGRPTKEEELLSFADHIGIEPELVKDFIGAAIPPREHVHAMPIEQATAIGPPLVLSAQEIRDEFLRLLYANRESLKGIALVNALKALATLAEHEKTPETEESAGINILDRIHSLPKEHAIPLLREEISRLDAAREGYFAAMNELLEAE